MTRLKPKKAGKVFQEAKVRADLVEKKSSRNKYGDSDENGELVLTDISRKILKV